MSRSGKDPAFEPDPESVGNVARDEVKEDSCKRCSLTGGGRCFAQAESLERAGMDT